MSSLLSTSTQQEEGGSTQHPQCLPQRLKQMNRQMEWALGLFSSRLCHQASELRQELPLPWIDKYLFFLCSPKQSSAGFIVLLHSPAWKGLARSRDETTVEKLLFCSEINTYPSKQFHPLLSNVLVTQLDQQLMSSN